MKIEHWEMDPELKVELNNHYKTAYSLSISSLDPIEIARALTFDSLIESLTPQDLDHVIETLNIKFLKGKIRGVGLEVGSGPGTFVATFANKESVEKIYGVEACEAIIRELMTKVVSYIAPENTDKVIGAVGDFDNLSLGDNTVDFVFDFFSLHHSTNPEKTLKEIHRVLKPSGVLICIDKARANKLESEDLETLLDKEYSREAKKAMGISEDQYHTRRMNGENEYRLKDWFSYMDRVGFTKTQHYNIAKIGGNFLSRAAKHTLTLLPVNLQAKLSGYVSTKIVNNLEPSNRIFINLFPKYPREFSLMIAEKIKMDR